MATKPYIWEIESCVKCTCFEQLIPTHEKMIDNCIFIIVYAVSLTEHVKHKPVKVSR